MGWTGLSITFRGGHAPDVEALAEEASGILWGFVRQTADVAPFRELFATDMYWDTTRPSTEPPRDYDFSLEGAVRPADGGVEVRLSWWVYQCSGSWLLEHFFQLALAARREALHALAADFGLTWDAPEPASIEALGADPAEHYFALESGELVAYATWQPDDADATIVRDPFRRASTLLVTELSQPDRARLDALRAARRCACPMCATLAGA